MSVELRFVITCFLSVFALLLAIFGRESARWVAFFAMLISSVGDLAMMDYKQFFSGYRVDSFYIGVILFVFAHLMYIAASVTLIKKSGYGIINLGFIVGAILTAVIALYGFYRIGKMDGDVNKLLIVVCAAYLLVIGLNCALVFSYSFSAKNLRSVAAIGAVLFLCSDLIIGLQRVFGMNMPDADQWIWFLYSMGQALVLVGI